MDIAFVKLQITAATRGNEVPGMEIRPQGLTAAWARFTNIACADKQMTNGHRFVFSLLDRHYGNIGT